jgi:hypothetical protein
VKKGNLKSLETINGVPVTDPCKAAIDMNPCFNNVT